MLRGRWPAAGASPAVIATIRWPHPEVLQVLDPRPLLDRAAVLANRYASFTSTTSASQTLSTGTVTISLGQAGTAANRLTVNASGLVPGDTVQRAADLTNSGNQALSVIALTTTANPSSLLDTDATNGLQMVVDSCPTSWTEAGTAPAYTYTCTGTGTPTVVYSGPVIASNASLAGLNSLAPAGVDHLRVTLSLPTAADNTFQGLTSTISYSFTGTQRAGSSH